MDKIYRVVDVNFNRVAEGLRVLEEIFRFIVKDKELSYKLKDIRHSLRQIASSNFLKFREIESDLGKDSFTTSEKSRTTVESIFNANLKRVQESLRVLEEFLKPVNSNLSFEVKKIRFQIYEIEQIFLSVKRKLATLLNGNTLLYGIIDNRF